MRLPKGTMLQTCIEFACALPTNLAIFIHACGGSAEQCLRKPCSPPKVATRNHHAYSTKAYMHDMHMRRRLKDYQAYFAVLKHAPLQAGAPAPRSALAMPSEHLPLPHAVEPRLLRVKAFRAQ